MHVGTKRTLVLFFLWCCVVNSSFGGKKRKAMRKKDEVVKEKDTLLGSKSAGNRNNDKTKKAEEQEEEIPLTEDLMREHGMLNRVMLIYEEIIKRMERGEVPEKNLAQAVAIIREFVENYHEKMEEDYLFPLFEKQKKKVTLVKTLRTQHTKGREITKKLQDLIDAGSLNNEKQRKEAITLLKKFIAMYRPHEAREDTELFPLVRSLMTEEEFEQMGEKFDDLEHTLFGEHGFENILHKVETIEKELGIYKLEQFTP